MGLCGRLQAGIRPPDVLQGRRCNLGSTGPPSCRKHVQTHLRRSRCSNLWAGCVHAELDPMFHLSMQRSSNGMEWLRVHAYVCRVRVCMQTCVQVVGAEKALTHKLATLGVCSECITFLLKGPRRGHCCTHRAALCSCRLSIVTHVSLIATWSAPALPHSHRRIVFKAAPWHLVPWRHSS